MPTDTVSFYIKNYISNGTIVTTETKFQSVPFSGNPVISNPKAKIDLGKAGSFEFDVDPTSPYYNAFQQMKTLIRIEYFGNPIFRGRVLTIDRKMLGTRTIHCEGDFAFLLDSHQIGTKEDTRPEISVLAYLQQIITQHNADMNNDTDKQFVLGEVPGQYGVTSDDSQKVNIPTDKASQKFGDTSWNTSMDRIENLLSDFGGYFRTRYVNGTVYLDWYDKYYDANLNTQTIEVAKNLIDLSGTTEVNNLFTVIVPIGKDKSGNNIYISDYWPIVSASHSKVDYITVPELASIPLYSDAELNAEYHKKADYQNAISKFGWIWKPVDFENADTPEKLFNYAKDWMKNNFSPEITQWSISAIDMKIVDPAKQYILCGDKVNVIHPEVSRVFEGMTVISVEYSFFDPKNNKYTIGIPNQEINASYGTKTKSKGGGGGGISNKNDQEEEQEKLAQDLAKLKVYLDTQYWRKTQSNKDITLDNPLAFTSYNTDVTEKDKSEAIKDMISTVSTLLQTKREKYGEIFAEAVRRGVSVDDPQLLIDFTPSVKQRQTQYRTQTSAYMVNTVGMTMQQAEVLVNETASQSFFSSLVDDNGDWTPYALSQGASLWANADDIKEQALNTKKWLSGKELPNSVMSSATKAFNTFQEFLSGDKLDIDNLINTDKIVDTVSGAVDTAVNFLDTNIKFEFNDGEESKAYVGKDSNDQWEVKINEVITYTDENDQQQTKPGFVSAKDFNIPSVASFKTKLAVVDTLIAGKASIGELEAAVGRIATLESEAITTTKLLSLTVNCASILTTYGVTAQGNLSGATLSVGGHGAIWQPISYVESLSLSLTGSHKFEDTDTGQIITGKLVSSYSKDSATKYFLVRDTNPD